MGIGNQIRSEATKITNKAVKPVKKGVDKLGKQLTKIQKMVKCPVSITSNITVCAPDYVLDLLGYVIYAIVVILRLPWVCLLNIIIFGLNWAIMPTIRTIINFVMWLIMKPEWKINGKLNISYVNPWINHKNDVIRYINIIFPFFNRTPHMNKCYCASSIKWVLQPLQVSTQTWSQWFLQLFHPVIAAVQWMFSLYQKMVGKKEEDDSMSKLTFIISGISLFLISVVFIWLKTDDDNVQIAQSINETIINPLSAAAAKTSTISPPSYILAG